MQPEILVQLVQLGSTGLLAFVLYFIMKQGQEYLSGQSVILKSLIEGNQQIMLKLIELVATSEIDMSKGTTLEANAEGTPSHLARSAASNVASFDTAKTK